MEQIPTAKEAWLKWERDALAYINSENFGKVDSPNLLVEAFKEFARLHVEAALKAAAIAADNDIFTYEDVLYAYPLENIK